MEQTSFTLNKDTTEVTIKYLLFKKKLVIDNQGIEFNKKYVPFSQVEGLRYGTTNIYVNGIHASVQYTFQFLEGNNKKLTVIFAAGAFYKKSKKEMQENNAAIIGALWKHLTSKMVNKMIVTLNSGGTVKVGNFEASRKGIKISFRKFIFRKQEVFLPWNDCSKGLGPGYFFVQSAANKKIFAKSSFLNTWNLNAFHSLINYLWEDGNCYKLERGENILTL